MKKILESMLYSIQTCIQKFLIFILFSFYGVGISVANPSSENFAVWKNLERGLNLGIFTASKRSILGDSLIRVLRADTQFFALKLLNSSASKTKKRHSVKEWVNQNSLIAGINASMYQKNQMSSVSYMKTGKHVNSTWLSKDKTILAFDPIEKKIPTVRLIDRECEDFNILRKQYATFIQSIRMVSCKGRNVWSPQNRMSSTAAVGLDSQGRVMFIHARSPYSTHELIDMLLQLPIDLERAMYVEGGTVAQLYINTEKEEHEFIGSYSTGSTEHNENIFSRPIPNVLGLVRIKK